MLGFQLSGDDDRCCERGTAGLFRPSMWTDYAEFTWSTQGFGSIMDLSGVRLLEGALMGARRRRS
jgi:hypothetical protein